MLKENSRSYLERVDVKIGLLRLVQYAFNAFDIRLGLSSEAMPSLSEFRPIVGRWLQPHRNLAIAAISRIAPMAKRLHLIQRHDEANRLIGLGLDGDDPPFGPKILAGDLWNSLPNAKAWRPRSTGLVRTLPVGFLACSNEWNRQGWFARQVLPMVVVDCGRLPGKRPKIKLGGLAG